MRTSLLGLICCPACEQGLEAESVVTVKDPYDIWDGRLRCVHCGRSYPVLRGIPHLYVYDESWALKAREAQGWVDFHKERGIYEQPEDAVDLKIPYYPEEPWTTVARSFDIALEELRPVLRPSMTVLDLGAGRGWAAKHFALRGCRAVALDINPDENVGLGRAWALMKHANVYFDLIIADGERLPLLPESFDLVFCAAALHHATDLPLLVKNIQRVIKPGGLLCAISEPCIAIDQSAERVLKRDAESELKHGINEHRPNLLEYWIALTDAGFAEVKFIWPPGYKLSISQLVDCAKDLGASYPGWSQYGWRINLRRWVLYLYHQVVSLPRRRGIRTLLAFDDDHQRLMRSILLWVSGEVILLAHSPA